MTDTPSAKMTPNLKLIIGLAAIAFVLVIAFQFLALKNLLYVTECIQVRQANQVYGLDTLPEGDDENSRAIRESLKKCNIELTGSKDAS